MASYEIDIRPEISDMVSYLCDQINIQKSDLPTSLYYADARLPADFVITTDEIEFIRLFIQNNCYNSLLINIDVNDTLYMYLGHRIKQDQAVVYPDESSGSKLWLFGLLGLGLVLASGKKNV